VTVEYRLKVVREQAIFIGAGVGEGWLEESQQRERQGRKPYVGHAWLVKISKKTSVARSE